MVNTWKNIHKNDSFGKKYKDYKNEIINNHYIFDSIEIYKGWTIYFDSYHKVYSVGKGIGLNRHFKSKKTAKQFINNHLHYGWFEIEALENGDLS